MSLIYSYALAMAIKEHPKKGSILTCDYSVGFEIPEMVKSNRPVIVLSPSIASRPKLCTIVALSTTPPTKVMPYHTQINISPALPNKFQSSGIWVKGDMVNAVGFHRLNLIRKGKDVNGKRQYYYHTLPPPVLESVYKAVLHGLGLSTLTKYI